MKVVHISTYDTGGAAVAALRLHAGLLEEKIDSSFLCLRKATHKQGVYRYEQAYKKQNIIRRILSRVGIHQLSVEQKNNESIKGLQGEYEKPFSFPATNYFVEQHELVKEADIIHLHWIAEFINYPSFFAVNKPIVWTLHDMNPFLGGFHYNGDDERNAIAYKKVNNEALHVKADAISKVQRLTVVSPSCWLLKSAENSNMFKQAKFEHIRYGLDTNIFRLQNKAFARSVFDIPADATVLLFVSESINNYRKGFELVADAFKHLYVRKKCILLTVGAAYNNFPESDHTLHLGSINDERLMSLVYAAADLFILPSREDNFPNVMLESLSCGTPVLAFKTGGMAEEIKDGFNGILAAEISGSAIANAINDFTEQQFDFNQQAIRTKAIERYALAKQASAYREVYSSMLVDH